MNYRKTLEYIESLNQYGSVLGLDTMRRLCEKLDHPEAKSRFIHVAGTNGKGSVSAYIAHILMAQGYRVGRYSSPAILDYRERFRIGERLISQKALCEYVERMRAVCEEIAAESNPHPTSFEMETALAFLYFYEQNCDYVVLETGMGGATDATNVIPAPIACVWTSISMDHMQYLGRTLSEIAAVKAGIAKEQALFISSKQPPEAEAALKHAAEEKGGRLILADASLAKGVKYGLTTQQFSYGGLKNLKIHLGGTFQIRNAVLAVETALQLKKAGKVNISEDAVYAGLEHTVWQYRMEILGKKPLFILDGAHNEDAARQLAESLKLYFADKNMIFIIGVLKDKEYEKILALTAGFASHILTVTPPENKRALDALELAKCAGRYHPRVSNMSSLEEAVEVAHLLADQDSVILCFGSLSYLGAIRQIYDKLKHKTASKSHSGTGRSRQHG